MSEHDDDLIDSERAALDAWAPLAPPAGFADRVLAARDATPAPVHRAPRWPFVVAALATAAAGAALYVAVREPSHAASGELVGARARTTRSLGDRAVAVAEPDATLTWRISDDGAAEIEQREGDVFYRVDRGGPFVVHTPAGDVRVTGTCFRLEIQPMTTKTKTKNLLLGGTLGAAIATGVVITVYEGHVIADSRTGDRTEIAAGQRATIDAEGRTTTIAGTGATTPDLPADAIVAATRDQLVARAQQQQNELAKLRTRVAELEAMTSADPRAAYGPEPGRTWFDPSEERLKAWAAECRVRVDEPSLDRWQPQTGLGKNERGLEASELPQVNAAMTEVQTQWKTLVRALYLETTGDVAGADTLSTEAMRREIEEKGGDDSVKQRIAQERAGLAQPPADLTKTTPFERMFRAYLALGDQSEAAIAKRLGAERAKAIRGDGWGSRHEMSGCPSGED